jgi:hypothetical protein
MVSDPFRLKTISKIVNVAETALTLAHTVRDITKELKEKPPVANDISDVNIQVIGKLQDTLGITQSRGTKFKKAAPILKLKDGSIIKTYRKSAKIDHVFLADSSGKMLFAGYVRWIHSDDLKATLSEIKTTFAASETDITQTPNKPVSRGIGTIVDITTEWNEQPQVANDISEISTQVIEKLSNTQGIAQADGRDFKRATPKFKLKDGTMIRTYKNPAGVDHIFLADRSGRMLFGGYVGWMHSENLEATIAEIKETFV